MLILNPTHQPLTGSAALLDVAQFLEDFPELHNQNEWAVVDHDDGDVCGTVACIAGWICLRHSTRFEITDWRLGRKDPPKVFGYRTAALQILGWPGRADDLFLSSTTFPNRRGETLPQCLRRLATGEDGYDADGFNWDGLDADGYDANGHNEWDRANR